MDEYNGRRIVLMESLTKIREIISLSFDVPAESVTENTTQADIKRWDSLGHVNLMVALENELDLGLEIEDFDKLTSVAAIVEFVESSQRT